MRTLILALAVLVFCPACFGREYKVSEGDGEVSNGPWLQHNGLANVGPIKLRFQTWLTDGESPQTVEVYLKNWFSFCHTQVEYFDDLEDIESYEMTPYEREVKITYSRSAKTLTSNACGENVKINKIFITKALDRYVALKIRGTRRLWNSASEMPGWFKVNYGIKSEEDLSKIKYNPNDPKVNLLDNWLVVCYEWKAWEPVEEDGVKPYRILAGKQFNLAGVNFSWSEFPIQTAEKKVRLTYSCPTSGKKIAYAALPEGVKNPRAEKFWESSESEKSLPIPIGRTISFRITSDRGSKFVALTPIETERKSTGMYFSYEVNWDTEVPPTNVVATAPATTIK